MHRPDDTGLDLDYIATTTPTPASVNEKAIRQGACFAVHLLDGDGAIYATDYYKDEVMAEVQGQAWVKFGGGDYRVERLVAQA